MANTDKSDKKDFYEKMGLKPSGKGPALRPAGNGKTVRY